MGPEDRRRLLQLARRALGHHLDHGGVPEAAVLGGVPDGVLTEPGAAFITLRHGTRLRGCIGRLEARAPLWQTVVDIAIGAATRDFRFASVTAEELEDVTIKISVLTPPRRVATWRDIVIGRHGIVLSKDDRASTFLPEVPVENGWDLVQTLDRLASKAGLPENSWREGAAFDVFESQVFSDEDRLDADPASGLH